MIESQLNPLPGTSAGGALQVLLDSLPIAVLLVDSDGRVELVNSPAITLFGYELAELAGRPIELLVPEDVQEGHPKLRGEYMESPTQRPMGVGRRLFARRKDGSEFPVEIGLAPFDLGGRAAVLCTILDLSELKRQERGKDGLLRRLSEKNAEISALYRVSELTRSGAPTASMLCEIARSIRSGMSGWSVSQLHIGAQGVLPVDSCDIVPECAGVRVTVDGVSHDDGALQETLHRVVSNIVVEARTRGTLEAYFALNQEHLGAGRGRLLQVFAGMIAEAIERSEAEAKVIHASQLASIGELAAGIGHEVNNPINGIINCADILLRNAEEGTKERQYLDLIRQESYRISSIVSSLLAFARSERSTPAKVSVHTLLSNVLALCGKRIEKSQITLQTNLDDDVPQVRCHPEQIQQVLLNLVLNAVHALDQRYSGADPNKILTISTTHTRVRDTPFVEIAVEDMGSGVRPEHRDRIFDPFFTTKGSLGTGLGLAVSLNIARAHNGWIRLETEPDRFSRFILQLPVDGEAVQA